MMQEVLQKASKKWKSKTDMYLALTIIMNAS